jgi:hypothetical protein
MPSNLRTRQQRFRGPKRFLQPPKNRCRTALTRCGLLQRCLRVMHAKKAKVVDSGPLRYKGVRRERSGRFQAIGRVFNIDMQCKTERHLGTFDTQEQAAQAYAAVTGPAAGGGLHLRPQPVEQSGFYLLRPPVAYCLLPAACCLLSLLPAACCLLSPLPVACCLLSVVYSLLPAAAGAVRSGRCWLRVRCLYAALLVLC